MTVQEQFARRVSERQVADVLLCLSSLAGKRRQVLENDIKGEFDFWFDGGAGKVQTGYTEYLLADGTRATVGDAIAGLSVNIAFTNGCRVSVQQVSWDETS